MENNTKQERISKILYIVIIAVLCVTAIVIGITAAANRGNKTPVATVPKVTTNAPVTSAPPVTAAPPATSAPVVNVLPEFVSPAVGVVAKGHETSVPVFSLTTNDWRTHTGIDIACALGDAVYAAADGTVESISSHPMMGTTVTIAHSGEGVTVYRNLSATLPEGIKVGARVISGQVIGAVGDTAMIESADEPHLHFEMTVKGEVVDPLEYISEESKNASLTVDTEYES